jgi:arginyl-tRNA synthetase
MVKYRISELLGEAVQQAQEKGLLHSATTPEIAMERPQLAEHGDYASSLPLKLARGAGTPPLPLAEAIVALIPPAPEVERAWAAPPGFINFSLSPAWLVGQVDAIIGQEEDFGNIDLGGGSRLQIEFVSVNPTGPLHIGHGRGAVLGSTLARVLGASGHRVVTEYYINDAGTQIETFHRSLFARYQQALGRESPVPEDGYVGDYLLDLGRELAQEHGDRFLLLPQEEAMPELGRMGMERMLARIRSDLELLGVTFARWFSEGDLYRDGQYQKAMQLLRQGGFVEEREGALWFASTALGESKDNVLVRSTGAPTYFATDIAYHYNKFVERGFPRVINIWGADHQGHISRMKTAASAMGVDSARLNVIISQMVTLRRGEEIVKISKRSGDIITLREVVDEVGPDVCRFFFLTRSPDAQMDFDLELAKKHSDENPVYYIQYAHTRMCGIVRHAAEKGRELEGGDVRLLSHEAEQALIRKLLLLPEVVELVTVTLEPHHLPRYSLELAAAFHDFYTRCRVVSRDKALTDARLKLVKASQIVLARALTLMGVTAPERM